MLLEKIISTISAEDPQFSNNFEKLSLQTSEKTNIIYKLVIFTILTRLVYHRIIIVAYSRHRSQDSRQKRYQC